MRTRYLVALIIVLVAGHVVDTLVNPGDPEDDIGDIVIIGTSPRTVARPTALNDLTDLDPCLRKRILAQGEARGIGPDFLGVVVREDWVERAFFNGPDESRRVVEVVDLRAGTLVGTFTSRPPPFDRDWGWWPAGLTRLRFR